MTTEIEFGPAEESAPRWQRRPEERPIEILDAALMVFGERGYAGTRLEDVARQAGVSKGTVYLYFESKEALFRAMVSNKVGAAITEVRETVRQHIGTSEELLRLVMERIWCGMKDEGKARLARLVHSELANFPELARFYFGEVVVPVRELVSEIITRGVRNGEFVTVEPQLAARTISLSLVHWAIYQRFLSDFDTVHFKDAEVFAGVSDLLLRGLKVSAPAARKD